MVLKVKTYEDQAKLSVILAIVGALATVGAVGLMLRNFDATGFFVSYRSNGPWLPIVGAGLLVGLGAGVGGFFIALNSAGQRRNKRSALSWQAFFLNALVVTVVLSACIFFYFTRNAVDVQPGA